MAMWYGDTANRYSWETKVFTVPREVAERPEHGYGFPAEIVPDETPNVLNIMVDAYMFSPWQDGMKEASRSSALALADWFEYRGLPGDMDAAVKIRNAIHGK